MEVKFKMNESAIANVISQLRIIDDRLSKEESKKIVTDIAERLKKASIERCPVDKHDLENAHEVQIRWGGGGYYGTVFIKNTSEAGAYAQWIHEDTSYKLGSKSKAKGQYPFIGPKFLERAYRDKEKELRARILRMIREAIAKR